MPELTVTERLRALLDERGVEWRETALGETRWLSTVLNGNVSAKRINDKLVLFTGYKLITPEQAIAATLGVTGKVTEKDSDECHADETDTIECVCDGIGHYGKRLTVHVMECSSCGKTYEHVNGAYEYCPHCRAKVVDE